MDRLLNQTEDTAYIKRALMEAPLSLLRHDMEMRIAYIESTPARHTFTLDDILNLQRLGIDVSILSAESLSSNHTKSKPLTLWERAVHGDSVSLNFVNGLIGVLAWLSYRIVSAERYIKENDINEAYPKLNGDMAYIGGTIIVVTLVVSVVVGMFRIQGLETNHIAGITKLEVRKLQAQELLKLVGVALAGFALLIFIQVATRGGGA